jgi:two-component system CheB/CheR fusion protein
MPIGNTADENPMAPDVTSEPLRNDLLDRSVAGTCTETDMERLLGVLQELSLARSLAAIQQIVRRAARELTGADGATFVLRDGDHCHYADEDSIAPLWKGLRFPLSACISGWTMLQRRAAVIEDIYADPRIPAGVYRPTFVKSLAMVPIRTADPIGAIGNYWARPHAPSAREIRLLQALADSTSTAIENVTLWQQLERAKEAAESASRLKDEFLATVSHELRTPLNPILAWSGLLIDGVLDEAEQREAVAEIHASAQLQLRHVDALLDVSRIVAGQSRLELAETALGPILDAALATIAPAAIAKGIRIERASDPAVGLVLADARRMQQVAWNLLANAVKFTPSGGTIRVALELAPDHVRLVVADSGIGIQPAFAPNLFERFRQADGTMSRAAGGMGLGLAMVRHLVELHGGTVDAASPGEGRGSTFTVSLPLPNASSVAA